MFDATVLRSADGAAVCDALSWANATETTLRGRVAGAWRCADGGGGGGVAYTAVVPPGSTASVTLPLAGFGSGVTEGGTAVWADGAFVAGVDGVAGAALLDSRGDAVVFEIGSGTYSFVVA